MHEARSKRLFKDIEPDVFVQVMEILHGIRVLHEKCHKYYALYKFYDLLDKLTLTEINTVARTFCKHKIKTQKVGAEIQEEEYLGSILDPSTRFSNRDTPLTNC